MNQQLSLGGIHEEADRVRFGLMLVVLALVIGLTGLADRKAEAGCTWYGNCDLCWSIEDACRTRDAYSECGGDSACCSEKASECYSCCDWFWPGGAMVHRRGVGAP